MKTSLLLVLISVFVLGNVTFGQDKFVSCHHTKNKIRPVPLTKKQQDDLAKNIARSDTFDITHYEIHLDVRDYVGDYLIANTIISYVPKMDGVTSITFDLMQLTVDSITSNGVPMEYAHEGTDLQIQLPTPTVTGVENDISIWYQGIPYLDPQWGGFYFQNNYIYNLGIGISTIPPNFGKVWYPCFDTYVERATYDFYVTSDDGWKAFCQGELMEEEVIDEETFMRHYHLDKPIPTYLSAVAVADYESYEYVHNGVNGEVPVRLTSKPANQASMQSRFEGLGSSIDALEYWYGPEYWGKVGFVITVDGAMEHPTNIAYPQSMLGQSVFANEGLFTHELGHHWWGDMVSQSTYNHMWLKEGPAEYSIHLMREWIGGEEAYMEAVKDNHYEVMETAHLSDDGFQVLSPIPDAYIYGTHSYSKGASVMHSLRGYMGDEPFKEALQFVLDSTLNGVLDPVKFQTLLTMSSGVPLEDFFNDWIYKPGFASFEVNSVNTSEVGGQIVNEVEVQQKLRECPSLYSNVPLEVSAFDENFVQHDFQFYSEGEISNFEFNTDFTPVLYVLNANNNLNLAKFDHHEIVFEETSTLDLPHVDFYLKVISIEDTSNVYVEHQWVSPDQGIMASNIDQLADRHYWTVSGDWDENTHLEGRLNYVGNTETSLDYNLYSDTEEGALLAYREGPGQEWYEYPYYTLYAGSLSNGNGFMRMDSLLAGEYAFAKGDPLVGINEFSETSLDISIYPNPATDEIILTSAQHEIISFDVLDNLGRKVKSFSQVNVSNNSFDISDLKAGHYTVRFFSKNNRLIGAKKLVVN